MFLIIVSSWNIQLDYDWLDALNRSLTLVKDFCKALEATVCVVVYLHKRFVKFLKMQQETRLWLSFQGARSVLKHLDWTYSCVVQFWELVTGIQFPLSSQFICQGKEVQSDPCALTIRARHAVTEAITSLTLQHKDIMTRKENNLAHFYKLQRLKAIIQLYLES